MEAYWGHAAGGMQGGPTCCGVLESYAGVLGEVGQDSWAVKVFGILEGSPENQSHTGGIHLGRAGAWGGRKFYRESSL